MGRKNRNAVKETAKRDRDNALVTICNLLGCTTQVWVGRYDFLAKSFGMLPSRFRTVREGRKYLSEAEVQKMKQVLGEPAEFVKFHFLMKGSKDDSTKESN